MWFFLLGFFLRYDVTHHLVAVPLTFIRTRNGFSWIKMRNDVKIWSFARVAAESRFVCVCSESAEAAGSRVGCWLSGKRAVLFLSAREEALRRVKNASRAKVSQGDAARLEMESGLSIRVGFL